MKKSTKTKSPPGVEAKDQPTAPSTEVSEAKLSIDKIIGPLSPDEKQQLSALEKLIDAKLGDFFEVGRALVEIKVKKLYRETHRNFNIYCHDHWGFGRGYANRLIGSAERIQLLPEDFPKPANEFQIRPFLNLEPAEFPKKWQTIVESAGTGKVTSKIVEDTLNLRRKRRGRPKGSKSKPKTGVTELCTSLRAALEEKNVEGAIKDLTKLEKLLGV